MALDGFDELTVGIFSTAKWWLLAHAKTAMVPLRVKLAPLRVKLVSSRASKTDYERFSLRVQRKQAKEMEGKEIARKRTKELEQEYK